MKEIEVKNSVILPLLAKTRYFSDLPSETLAHIVPVTRALRAFPGEDVIQTGETGDEMYMIVRGRAEVLGHARATGAEQVLATLEAGACFGELAIVREQTRTATVRAIGDLDLIAIGAKEFRTLIERIPAVALAVIDTLAEWLATSNKKVNVPFVNLRRFPYDLEIVRRFDERRVAALKAVPLRREGERITVAMTEPSNLLTADAIRQVFDNAPLEIVAVTQAELEAFWYDVICKQPADPWGDGR